MNKGEIFLGFALGAAVGSFITYKILNIKIEKLKSEKEAEIDSVKDAYEQYINEGKVQAAKLAKDKPPVEELANKVEQLNYTSFAKKAEESEQLPGPYIIKPDEFDTVGHSPVWYNYYNDGVLTDELDEVIEDISKAIGPEAQELLVDSDESEVYIRRDDVELDICINRLEESYEDTHE